MRRKLTWMGAGATLLLVACTTTDSTSPSDEGVLTTTISGLPAGASASVTVTGPGGFSRALTATSTLDGLTPGGYTVASANVTSAGHEYAPQFLTQTVQVVAGTPVEAQVAYSITTGAIDLAVTGLPSGTNAAIAMSGPAGYQSQQTGSAIITGLAPGSYTIVASDVQAQSETFGPTPPTQTVMVAASTSPVSAPVGYQLASGSLAIGLTGLPMNTTATVTVTGANSFSQTVTAPFTFTAMLAGDYDLVGNDVVVSGDVYSQAPTPLTATVQVGAPTQANLTFVQTSGTLDVTIVGLPNGVDASVTVTGPSSYSASVTVSETLSGLEAGQYTVTASQVIDGATAYDPTPTSQAFSVAAGGTESATVTYGSGGPVTLNLTIDGMYLVQSAQRYDGTVPLVQGRDAYLRVFATANLANTVMPDVRVRLYDSGALQQTYTLTANSASVPLTVDQGDLNLSWNVLVPASLIQPNLEVLADVDPADNIVEMSEVDNSFPTNAQPLPIDVRPLPALPVRLIPVHQSVNSRTGNVNTGNADQFMDLTERMFPSATYDVDVRATYTTSAPELQSSDGNGAWGTVLSEIRTLRNVTDGSSKYYYGVVNVSYSSGVAGLGYVPSSPSSTSKASIGWDYLPSGSSVMAHELGHNFGRDHAPCGNPAGVDPSYPYPGGEIGTYGMDVASLLVKDPTTYKDLMTYCSPEWISDYTYEGVFNFREASPSGFVQTAPATNVVLVWGRIRNDSIILEPAFEMVAPPRLPEGRGPYTVDARDAAGNRIFNYAFSGDEVADLPGGPERHFSFLIPKSAQRQMSSLQITANGRTARRATAPSGRGAAIRGATPVQLVRRNGNTVDLQWDPRLHPMVLVRDPQTGDIISFARGGAASIWSARTELDVIVSDGVVGTASRMRVVGQ